MGKSKDLATGAAYQDQTESDTRYANVAGDTFTGNVVASTTLQVGKTSISNQYGSSNGYVADFQATSGTQTYISIAEPNASSLGDNGLILGEDTSATYLYQRQSKPMNFGTGNTTRMTIDASGRVTLPYQPAFRAYSTVAGWTVLSANTWVIGAFEAEEYDRGSNYNTTNYRFTAPIAGLYQFTLHVYARVQSGGQGTNSNYWTARFGINGQTQGVHCIVGYLSDGDVDNTCTVTSTFDLSANDYVEVYLRGHTSSAEYYRSLCSFEGRLVG